MIRSWLLGLGLAVGMVGRPAQAPAQMPATRPRLVLVISIDQFRADYLQRFRRWFVPGGFNLLLRRGASFSEAYYEHGVTLTCPGHSVILTGAYPHRSGIVANEWFDLAAHKAEYCAADTTFGLIGVGGEGRSPRNLLVPTVGDELKQATGGRSRIITLAGKDRSAIMLAGHRADAAYWTEDTLLVTSRYYMRELPAWVQRFNSSGAITKYQGRTWNRLLPAEAYRIAGSDNVAAEEDPGGMGRTFPHRLGSTRSQTQDFIAGFGTSPFENEVLVNFAMEAVVQEQLGEDEIPDLLGIGFSANDAVGHSYGPDSHELMDITLRTDRELERLFRFLDQRIGLDRMIVVLTADHGVAPLPEVARGRSPKVNAARLDPRVITTAAERALRGRYGAPRGPVWLAPSRWVVDLEWPWIYLNLPALEDKRVPVEEAEQVAQAAMMKVRGVAQVFTAAELQRRNTASPASAELTFYPGRSGQLYLALAPYVIPDSDEEGTTHGSPWVYDTHVPLLWLGGPIPVGPRSERVAIADVAPTLAALLGIATPAGSEGRVLRELFPQTADSTTTAMP